MNSPSEFSRERGTLVSWTGMGMGRIRADDGASVAIFYWSIVEGFRKMTVGRRVEFTRVPFGATASAATLVVPADEES